MKNFPLLILRQPGSERESQKIELRGREIPGAIVILAAHNVGFLRLLLQPALRETALQSPLQVGEAR
ncbi:MAG: hypothetical protein OXC19_02785 [Bryobacterales bacterium]|nr:hypothetical protein [Bryobacterales bacterium]